MQQGRLSENTHIQCQSLTKFLTQGAIPLIVSRRLHSGSDFFNILPELLLRNSPWLKFPSLFSRRVPGNTTKHKNVEQRISSKAICSMHRNTGTFTGSIDTVHYRASEVIGIDATH